MHVIFRVDASLIIGTGHVMRCLTLAAELIKRGATVSFICRELHGHLCELIEQEGYQVFRLPPPEHDDSNSIEQLSTHSHWLGVNWRKDAEETIQILKGLQPIDWLIVDHYAIDKHWELAVRKYVSKIMVIDDLADREHICDLLLDQNYDTNIAKYDHLVSKNCYQLLGPDYALLRPSIIAARQRMKTRDGSVKRILVFMGGSDPDNVTEKVLNAILLLRNNDFFVDVVVGMNNKHRERIKQFCLNHKNFSFHYQVNNIEELIIQADLSIGAGGTTTWERCYLGLPSIVLSIATNQENIARHLAKKDCIYYLGPASKITETQLADQLKKLMKDKAQLERMSLNGMKLVDGLGLKRVGQIMIQQSKYNISIVSDKASWINEYIPVLISKIEKDHYVKWVHELDKIPKGDFAFFLSCGRIAPPEILARNKHNLVVHESDLPKGKGWSPLTWQILEGENTIPIVLFEAVEAVDSGKIYLRDVITLNGFELIDEIREKQALKTIQLCLQFIYEYPEILEKGEEQRGEASFYPRRTPKDSRLDPDKTIREQFNLLRVVDNERYPAFFEINGEKYIIKIERERKQ